MDNKENKDVVEIIDNFLKEIKEAIVGSEECPIELKIANELDKLNTIFLNDVAEKDYPDKVLKCILDNVTRLRKGLEDYTKKLDAEESSKEDDSIPLF